MIYSRLADVVNNSREIVLKTDEKSFEEFYELVKEFRSVFESKKMWLDTEICNQIEQFAIEIDRQVRIYEGSINVSKFSGLHPNHLEKVYESQEDFHNFILGESKKLKDQLEEMLRVYLSPEPRA